MRVQSSRLTRRLLNLCTLLSLLACVATLALWARSYLKTDIARLALFSSYRAVVGGGGVVLESIGTFRRHGDMRTGDYKGGRLTVYVQHQRSSATTPDGERLPRWVWVAVPYNGRDFVWGRAWIPRANPALPRTERVEVKSATHIDGAYQCDEDWLIGHALWLPYWLPAALTAALPATRSARTWRRRRARRMTRGLCRSCGYKLTGNVSGTCPECGAPTRRRSAAP